ncbi:MAG: hypothetical protein M3Z00_05245 [Actinomycetota bacterium]|nr:hypothetical protein [Actinomycetota bacterium]
MGTVIGVIAFFVTLVGLLATLGYTGFLWQLDRVAAKRAGGAATQVRVKKRMPVALGATGAAVLGMLLTFGGITPDIIGIILAGGAGVFSSKELRQANKQL